MTIAPTLMIGLGGVGSRIVDSLYEMLPEEQKHNVVIHAIDTNHNDLGRLKHLNRDSMDQIGSPLTVGEYIQSLERAGLKTTLDQWCPENIPPHITMSEGAGQTRAVARIAYHATLRREGKLPNLERRLPELFEIGRSNKVTNTRVMIVSTLAGGTGAGTFLQTALYIRGLLKSMRPDSTSIVRGAFILPSMAERFNEIEFERDRMGANGYACMKELNAMVLNSNRPNVQLEYRPDQALDAEGRVNLSVPPSPPIFNNVFVYEASTRRGDFLRSWKQYESQVTETLFLQFFSPGSAKNFSQEDNIFTTNIGENTNRVLGSSGSASIEFPRADLLRYFAMHWCRALITKDWLAMDNAYKDQRRIWQQEGAFGSGPVRSEIYLQQLRNEAEQRPPASFFQHQWRSLHKEEDQLEQVKGEKPILFLDEVDARIHETLEGSRAYKEAKSRFNIPSDLHLSEENQIEEQIASGEADLMNFRHMAEKTIGDLVYQLINDFALSATRQDAGWPDYSLMKWLRGFDAPLHPVAVRYFLYRVEEVLRRRLGEDSTHEMTQNNRYRARRARIGRTSGLQDELERRGIAVRRYDEQYNVPDTGITEQAVDHVSRALEQGMLGRIFRGNQIKAFAREYVSKSRAQYHEIQQYAHCKLRLLVYKELLACVEQMSRDWESCFDALPTRLELLREQEERLARLHDENINPTRMFVLASRKCKEYLWQDQGLSNEYEGTTAFEGIVGLIYTDACDKHKRASLGRVVRNDGGQSESRAVELLSMIEQWCESTLREKGFIDFNVVQAMKMEAEIHGLDAHDQIIQRFTDIDNRAQPWLVYDHERLDQQELRKYQRWFLHPDVEKELGKKLSDEAYAAAKDGAGATTNPGFSPCSIFRYRSVGFLAAEDLHDFSDGAGVRAAGKTFQRYYRWIRHVEGPNAPRITPHLDKRWHLPAYLPDINSDRVVQDLKRLHQGFLFGLIYEHIQAVKHERTKVWMYTSRNTSELIRMNDVPVSAELHRLYDALLSNPQYVDQVLIQARIHQESDIPKGGKVADTSFYKRVRNMNAWDNRSILDLVLSMRRAGGGRRNVQEAMLALLQALLSSLGTFYCDFHEQENKGIEFLTDRHRDSLQYMINKMIEDSDEYNGLEEGDSLKVQVDQTLNGFLSRIGSQVTG